MNLLIILVAPDEVGHNIVFNWLLLDIFLKLDIMELIFPKKQARLISNKLQFNKKCSSSPIWPEQQNLHKRMSIGVGGEVYLIFSISRWWAEQRNLVKNERWDLDWTKSK